MASIGLKYMGWAKMATEPTGAVPTFETGRVLGRLVSTQLTVNKSEGELYADDMLAEYVSEFTDADLKAEVDNISLENQALIYGETYADSEFKAESGSAPYGGVGGYQVLMVQGAKKYRAWFFPKARASMPDWSGATKGKSTSFGTQPITMKILRPNYGPWYYVKEFSTEAAAQAYVDTKLGVATWYNVDVQVQGATGTEAASPVGLTSVASGENCVISIMGTATALYDNGVESKSSIAGGKYTITSIAADHKIAVIF